MQHVLSLHKVWKQEFQLVIYYMQLRNSCCN